jgi:hypothetical protein
MKRLASILLLCSITSGCASMRRHPAIYGLAIGAGVGIAAGLITKGVNCPQTEYEGKPYSGRSPGCPKPEPGEKQ